MGQFKCESCKKTRYTGMLGATKLKCVKCGAVQCGVCAREKNLMWTCYKCGGYAKKVFD